MNTFKDHRRGLTCALALSLVASVVQAQPPGLTPEDAKRYEAAVIEQRKSNRDIYERLLKRAESGDPDAQYELGWYYENGKGGMVPTDFVEAVKWYRKAAEQGDLNGQAALGVMYAFGHGVPRDDGAAFTWYLAAAEQGSALAQSNLGALYLAGGVRQDYAEAMKWFEKAAAQRDGRAQANIGSMYENGKGVTRDYAEALKWYREAAGNFDRNGQAGLARLYHMGWGVKKDDVEALKWARDAAKWGHVAGAYNVGFLLLWGEGIPQDRLEALTWYIIAIELVKNPDEFTYDDEFKSMLATSRAALSKAVSAETVARAQQDATTWLRSYELRK
jgi:TPR repeat protein